MLIRKKGQKGRRAIEGGRVINSTLEGAEVEGGTPIKETLI